MAEPLLSLESVGVAPLGEEVLSAVSFTIHQGEFWVLAGNSGSGKTSLAHAIAQKVFYTGDIRFYFPVRNGERSTILLLEQQHRFKNLSNTTELYYQQRFNSYDAEQTITAKEAMAQHGFSADVDQSEWLDLLGVRRLLPEPLIQLSNGENKRLQLLMALLDDPRLLILDNPFIGLDPEGRSTLTRLLDIIRARGVDIILICGLSQIPHTATHIAWLEDGTVGYAGKMEDFDADFLSRARPGIFAQVIKQWPGQVPASDFRLAVKMTGVQVRYGERQILQGIDWEVAKGECWSLSGPNGAGKSTLLSLITADNPQAYANEIYLFDKRRGMGESIWDIKRKIGFVSPELHLYFDYCSSCFEVIASGLFDTIGLFRHLSEDQRFRVGRWLELFGLERLAKKRFSQLSTSEQRRALLARALIKTPPLLILDEPCQGLDEQQTLQFKELITDVVDALGSTLIFVSHYQDQIPSCVHRYLRLAGGRVVH